MIAPAAAACPGPLVADWVDRYSPEIAYRWGQEASAMRRLSDNELEVVFKNGWKPSEYVASRDG